MVDGTIAYAVTKIVYALSSISLVMPRSRPLMVSSYLRKYPCWYTIITMYGSNNHATPKLICSPEIHTTVRGRPRALIRLISLATRLSRVTTKKSSKLFITAWALRWKFRTQNAKSMSICTCQTVIVTCTPVLSQTYNSARFSNTI